MIFDVSTASVILSHVLPHAVNETNTRINFVAKSLRNKVNKNVGMEVSALNLKRNKQ